MRGLVIISIFSVFTSIGLSQSNDTLYFKSGHVIPCTIFAYNDSTVAVEYKNHLDEKITEIISISMLKSFVDLNSLNQQIFFYEDGNAVKSEPTDSLDLMNDFPKYNDSLFYKSGMVKVCEVIKYDGKDVEYRYTNSRGNDVVTFVSKDQLKYFVTYDSYGFIQFSSVGLHAPSSQVVPGMSIDSMTIRRQQFSISPYSILILGIDNTFRFGKNYQFGIHLLNQISIVSLFMGNSPWFYNSIGMNFYIINKPRSSMFIGLNGAIVSSIGQGSIVGGFPVSIGFVRNINPRLAIDGYFGLGPGIGMLLLPMAHFGITALFGKEVKIKADKTYY